MSATERLYRFITPAIEKLIARLGKRITSRIAERTQRREPDEDEFVVNALDQYDYFDNVEQHWHHVLAFETEVWF